MIFDSLLAKTQPESRTKFLVELFLATRFAIVGGVCTVSHMVIVWVLLSKTSIPIMLANAIAFTCNFGFSFAGNYFWTFSAPGAPKTAAYRFLLIAVTALVLNNCMLAFFLKFGLFDPINTTVYSVLVIPIFSFFASRFWGFANSKSIASDTVADNVN